MGERRALWGKEALLAELRGKRISVDFELMLHKYALGFRLEDESRDPKGVLKGFFLLCLKAASNGTRLVFCQDGNKGKVLKEKTMRERNERVQERKNDLCVAKEQLASKKKLRQEQEEAKRRESEIGALQLGGEEKKRERQVEEAEEEEEKKKHKDDGIPETKVAWSSPKRLNVFDEQAIAAALFGDVTALPPFNAHLFGDLSALLARIPVVRPVVESNITVAIAEEANSSEREMQKAINKQSRQLKARLEEGDIDSLKRMIELFGFDLFKGTADGEKAASLLNQLGVVDGVMSDDSDAVAYGASSVLRWGFTDKMEVDRKEKSLWVSQYF